MRKGLNMKMAAMGVGIYGRMYGKDNDRRYLLRR